MAGDRSWMFRPPFDPRPERKPTREQEIAHGEYYCDPGDCPLCAKERADDDAHDRARDDR